MGRACVDYARRRRLGSARPQLRSPPFEFGKQSIAIHVKCKLESAFDAVQQLSALLSHVKQNQAFSNRSHGGGDVEQGVLVEPGQVVPRERDDELLHGSWHSSLLG
jgi:hypothetical protein